MREPPPLIDGVRVVRYCIFDAETIPTGRRKIFVGDDRLDLNLVRGLVIGEGLVDQGIMMMHCDSDWEAFVGFHYESTTDAMESADAAYSRKKTWIHFRALTSTELAELERCRNDLEQWAKEYRAQDDEA